MIFDYSLAGLVSAGLLFYLTLPCCVPSGSNRIPAPIPRKPEGTRP